MRRVSRRTSVVAAAATLAIGAATWRLWWFVLPLGATGEVERLAAAIGAGPGAVVADIGAGTGAIAERMTRLVGAAGTVYATELSAERREDLAQRKQRGRLDTLQVVTAAPSDTGLPDVCCDALYMRHVFHHVTDRPAFVAGLTRAVRPRGRVAVIDFPPGVLWFEGLDHGVTADEVLAEFSTAGWRLRDRVEAWGGGAFLLVFER